MTSIDALVLVTLLSFGPASGLKTAGADCTTTLGAGHSAERGDRVGVQAPPVRRPPRDDATDAEVRAAMGAIERAETFEALVEAIEQHEDIIASVQTVAMVDQAVLNAAPGSDQHGLLVLGRQLSLDCRQHGARRASRLLAVRLIAASALAADTAEQFARTLESFAPLAAEIDADLVRVALAAPVGTWPPSLLRLMEQLARDWPESGALAAARRMAQAGGAIEPAPESADSPGSLVGHWRSTEIVFESPQDEHLVLRGDGTAETWIVTASSRAPPVRGRWVAQAKTLTVDWEDGRQWSQPFTFHEGQLVFPNVEGRRQFWTLIE